MFKVSRAYFSFVFPLIGHFSVPERPVYRKLAAFLICILSIPFAAGQFYTIKGRVTNHLMEPIAFVNVAVKERPTAGTQTDINGNFTIQIPNGSYELVFSFVGFKTFVLPVTIKNTNVVQNIILETDVKPIAGVTVSSKRQDISEEIIRKVIERKERFLRQGDYSVNVYIKATEENEEKISRKQKKKKAKVDSLINPADTMVRGLNMAEIFLSASVSPPNKLKEKREGITTIGNTDGLFYLSLSEGEFSFYHNLISAPSLSQSPFLSPLSNSGLIAYKYRFIRSFFENNRKVYEIKISPGIMGNALFSGTMQIYDSLFCLKSLDLSFPRYHMVEYDNFQIHQDYLYTDSGHFLTNQEFTYQSRMGSRKSSGQTVVTFSNYHFKKDFNKKFFNNEISSAALEAYERDSSFWQQVRAVPLTPRELKLIRQTDSLKAITEQKWWQDSVDAETNKITMKKLFVTGQSNYLRSKERTWQFKPAMFIYLPVYVAGPRIDFWANYEREYKNKKRLDVFVRPNYGLLNEDFKGSFSINHLYNPFRRSEISVSAFKDFAVINPFNSYLALFSRSNFFEIQGADIGWRRELINGLFVRTSVDFSIRSAIDDYTFVEEADSLWKGYNDPVSFELYNALYGNLSLSYTPFQKYIREPYQKLILGSRWPTFSINYRKGISKFSSTVDFDYLEYRILHDIKLGLFGVSSWRFASGKFLNTADLRLIDYRFQRSGWPILFTNPLHSFQGLDTSFPTTNWFYEFHYFHRFNGALINKIPLLKKLNLVECVGGGYLYSTDRKLSYFESYAGFEKVIKLWKERFRLGLFLVAAESNQFHYKPQLKFTIEYYNRRTNEWSY